ncbi:MAG: phosphotransferase [Bacteroidetes bacterium]|nr:phosphotransferase [Bacteroidota bacterium]
MKYQQKAIENLLSEKKFPKAASIRALPSSGSDRQYFRVDFDNGSSDSILAAYNPDVQENMAWNSFSSHFRSLGFHVPEILARDESYRYFLLQDLGNTSLFYHVSQGINEEVIGYYKRALQDLIGFQVEGIKRLDLDVAYPATRFDLRSVMWDLNYFKYYFVKPNGIIFNEARLEDDFEVFAAHLLEAESEYFMYRDFQSRNIMIHNDELWYIDFQGGRKGPLQYDLVSLLFQARANLSPELRSELKSYYLKELEKVMPGKTRSFNTHYPAFILFRLMQVLGAYGFRGQLQRKTHFLKSTKLAVKSLTDQLEHAKPELVLPELYSIFEQIIALHQKKAESAEKGKLKIKINSFSFIQSGIPDDPTQNGGGFVFDCRALPNPGRIKELRDFNGLQDPVIHYLDNKGEVKKFLDNMYLIIDQSIDNYLERGFENLQVNFGCTGGKHRSVYCAEMLAKKLTEQYQNLDICVNHLMSNDW